VAERIVAAPRGKAYGRLAVLSQWRARPTILFDVPPTAFVPPPKVTSSIVHIEPTAPPADAPSVAALERVTAAAFGQRRKMLRAALKQLMPQPELLLKAAGIAPIARAEEVDVAGFCRLARAFEDA
jgi:16S rRNA (adenine1518-N6/adenine1519-N6)-dimethyltransferase